MPSISSYLPTKTADYTSTTLNVGITDVYVVSGNFSERTYRFDDASTTTVMLSSSPEIIVRFGLNWMSANDVMTVLDFYLDSNKAFGTSKSFYWRNPVDSVTYVAKFVKPPEPQHTAGYANYVRGGEVTLRLIGVKP